MSILMLKSIPLEKSPNLSILNILMRNVTRDRDNIVLITRNTSKFGSNQIDYAANLRTTAVTIS